MPFKEIIDNQGVTTGYQDIQTGRIIGAREFSQWLSNKNHNYTPAPATQQNTYATQIAKKSVYNGGAVAPIFRWNQEHIAPQPRGFAPIARPASASQYNASAIHAPAVIGFAHTAAKSGASIGRHGQTFAHAHGNTQTLAQTPAPASAPAQPALIIPTDDSPLVQPGATMMNGAAKTWLTSEQVAKSMTCSNSNSQHSTPAPNFRWTLDFSLWIGVCLFLAIASALVLLKMSQRKLSSQAP